MVNPTGTFVVNPEHMSKFAEIARRKGQSTSALLRLLVAEYIETQNTLTQVSSKVNRKDSFRVAKSLGK
jgi:hypothetical protein